MDSDYFKNKQEPPNLTKTEDQLVEDRTLALRQEGIVERATILSVVYAIGFGLYGISSHSFIKIYRPDITLWHNVWPRLVLNTLPFFLLAWFLRYTKFSPAIKTLGWAIAWPLIYIITTWIHVFSIFFDIDPNILFQVHGANLSVFIIATLWITPLPWQMILSFLILVPFVHIPTLYGLLGQKGNSYVLTLFVNDEILFSSIVFATTYFSHRLLTRLIKNEQVSQDALKREVMSRDKIISQKTKEAVELEIAARLGRQSAQIAHDLRSPLAALRVIASDLIEVKESKRAILTGSINRLQEIAQTLLGAFQANLAEEKTSKINKEKSIDLLRLVNLVVSEKHAQYAHLPTVKLTVVHNAIGNSYPYSVEPSEFQRILSNLIDNAFESIEHPKSGSVTVELTSKGGFIFIYISDTGKGIPLEILPFLGQRGFSFGKMEGSGLGIYHAKGQIEKWGGVFRVDVVLTGGSQVTICFPEESGLDYDLS